MLRHGITQILWRSNYIKLFFVTAVILLCFDNAFSATELEFINVRTIKGKNYMFTVTGLFEGQNARYIFHTEGGSDIVSGTYLQGSYFPEYNNHDTI